MRVHCFSSSRKIDPDPRLAADALLLDRIGQGNVQALAQLYDRYSTLIYVLALRLSGDSAAAEEIVVDVFWELWQSADHFKGHSRLAAALLAATWRRAQQLVYQRL